MFRITTRATAISSEKIGQMNWILNNKAAFNIKAVIQGGDIVNQNQSDTQWAPR